MVPSRWNLNNPTYPGILPFSKLKKIYMAFKFDSACQVRALLNIVPQLTFRLNKRASLKSLFRLKMQRLPDNSLRPNYISLTKAAMEKAALGSLKNSAIPLGNRENFEDARLTGAYKKSIAYQPPGDFLYCNEGIESISSWIGANKFRLLSLLCPF